MMIDFEIYVDDARYSVPSFYLISAGNEARARAIATEMLHACDHHQGVELRRDGETIYTLGSFAAQGRARGDAEAASL
jgi:hypothetical protein